jgi:hypothetical protein
MESMTLEQYILATVVFFGLLASALPQDWRITKVLTKLGALTFRATTKLPLTLLFVAASLTLSGCGAPKPGPTQTAEGAKVLCMITVQLAPKSEELAKQYGLTVDEFALQACVFVGQTARLVSVALEGIAGSGSVAGAPAQ